MSFVTSTTLRFVALVVPVLFILGQIILESLMTTPQKQWMLSENGPHEWVQFAALVIAAGVAARTFITMDRRHDPLMTGWIALAFLCCVYVAGEEISWGQHLFLWSTPEPWAAVNDQGETNLHNTSAWLDQKPRLILEIGIITGGILIPLYRYFRPQGLPERFTAFYPPVLLTPLAVLLVIVKLSQSLMKAVGLTPLFHRVSEVQELLMFLFVMVYILILYKNLVLSSSPK